MRRMGIRRRIIIPAILALSAAGSIAVPVAIAGGASASASHVVTDHVFYWG